MDIQRGAVKHTCTIYKNGDTKHVTIDNIQHPTYVSHLDGELARVGPTGGVYVRNSFPIVQCSH